jgi:RNA polymerase sigma factor (sigma-70 family)
MESTARRSLDRLLGRAILGSRSAVDQLMASCRPWLRQRVQSRLPRYLARKQDASDLVQECQYLAAAHLADFHGQGIGDFRAWLVGILNRRVCRAMRFWGEKRRDQKREEPLVPGGSLLMEPAQSAASVVDRLSQEEECQQLSLAVSWCCEQDRAVVSMHLFEGQSHDEIAAELGIATAAARQRYCRAIRRIAQAMHLLALMTRRGYSSLQQDTIGLHQFEGAQPSQIAGRLGLPEELINRWIAEAKPWLRTIAKDGP